MADKGKILIIEDDQYLREVYEETLKEAGYTVETATNGQEGLLKAEKGGYVLILLDIMMQTLDGIGFLKRLKQRPPSVSNGPIVLSTNMAHSPVIEEGLALGAAGYIIKTDVTPDLLVKKVGQWAASSPNSAR